MATDFRSGLQVSNAEKARLTFNFSMKELFLARASVPMFLFGPTLREALLVLYGQSREAKVLQGLLSSGPLSLTAIARMCSASERALRGDGKVGWIRAILQRYCEAGILIERDTGNRITYELVESAPAVVLLRELHRIA